MPRIIKPEALIEQLRTLESKIGLIETKLRTFEQNQEVLSRTLVSVNERVRRLEAGAPAAAPPAELRELRAALEELKASAATKEEVKQLRYVIDLINPLEYATIDQVRELLHEFVEKLAKEKR